MEVSLHNELRDIALVHKALDELGASHQLASRPISRLHLALEEHLTNVIRHGYPPGRSGTVTVRFAVEPGVLQAEVLDDGAPFDPTQAPEVDTSLPLEQRPLGGLGVHMIRKSVDELQYRRNGDRNVLTLKMRLAH